MTRKTPNGNTKDRVRTTCPSCGTPVSGTSVVVVTELPEDDGQTRAFVVHEGCQNAMIRDLPWANDADQSAVTGRPRF